MTDKRERVFYRVYEVMSDGSDEQYADVEGPGALAYAHGYADQIVLNQWSAHQPTTAVIYKVTEIEEKVN